MGTLNVVPGDKVAVMGSGDHRIATVSRVLKNTIVLEDGTRWTRDGGNPVPQKDRWGQYLREDIESARRSAAIQVLQKVGWGNTFTTDQLESAAEALEPGSTLRGK